MGIHYWVPTGEVAELSAILLLGCAYLIYFIVRDSIFQHDLENQAEQLQRSQCDPCELAQVRYVL